MVSAEKEAHTERRGSQTQGKDCAKPPKMSTVVPFFRGGRFTGDFYFITFCRFSFGIFHLFCMNVYYFRKQRKTINVISKRKKTSMEGEQSLPHGREAERGGVGE